MQREDIKLHDAANLLSTNISKISHSPQRDYAFKALQECLWWVGVAEQTEQKQKVDQKAKTTRRVVRTNEHGGPL